jgi:hypothetical protein
MVGHHRRIDPHRHHFVTVRVHEGSSFRRAVDEQRTRQALSIGRAVTHREWASPEIVEGF